MRLCFYSLQTGRRFQTNQVRKWAERIGEEFLFPSNGTAFLNDDDPILEELIEEGFLFPSTGKAFLNKRQAEMDGDGIEFLFPSNGKAFLNLR